MKYPIMALKEMCSLANYIYMWCVSVCVCEYFNDKLENHKSNN